MIEAADGATLKAWYVHPGKFNGKVVVLLHGITDNREGVAAYAELFSIMVMPCCCRTLAIMAKAAERSQLMG